ncbi:MAG: aminoacyl-tRNA hydrolase [Candidatus Omnitrophica bacterium]|nr:aminoacyl-tRNA hydrolase [Candidatus Omnitrophota bacterium]
MKGIVGVGNPGKPYERTRHNVGFAVLDAAAAEWEFKKIFHAEVADWKEALLLKPRTFVNRTGEAVLAFKKRKRAKDRDLLLVCDDVHLEFGKLRLRESGSAGGHHGLESVIEALGSQDFPRLRIGIGKKPLPRDLVPFVLDRFSPEEARRFPAILAKAVAICETWVEEGFESARHRLSQLQSLI